ncbi:MAG TPA: hypothetical protein VL866_23530 [Pyrinomonadaceae bacterium]|nr:hypothetical protein [Pyrinomonadaceae bacterium]
MRKLLGVVSCALFVAIFLTISATTAKAQQVPVPPIDPEANLDTQLYLIVGTNQDVDDARLPASLDNVIKQLRASLPFKNYRLAATLVNRVRNEGRLDLRWIGGPFAGPTGTASATTPSFSEFKIGVVKLARNAEGQAVVHMLRFSFGARIPIVTGTTPAQAGTGGAPGGGFPIINYDNTGLNTDISLREGEPVVVGTLNAGPSGDAIILVVSAKRTNR